jgi:sulfonate transport system substrate-binding protein
MLSKRQFLAAALSTGASALAGRAAAADNPKEIRIGYQKSGVLLITKQQELLEKRFGPLGITVKWVEFSFGPPLLEALNTGSIDYGATGDAPPIFAQAAKANLFYVAAQPGRGDTQAIVVPKDSPIQRLEDLKGRKVGFAKASSAHNLTIAALDSVGIAYADITPLYLPPADAAAAFSRGALDAWTIWDPYLAIAEITKGARRLPISEIAAAQNTFFLANREFTTRYPTVVAGINTELARATAWAKDNRDAAARLYAAATGVDLVAMQKTVGRTEYVFTPVSEKVLGEQQRVADRFHRLGLIPQPIKVKDIVWTWDPNS